MQTTQYALDGSFRVAVFRVAVVLGGSCPGYQLS